MGRMRAHLAAVAAYVLLLSVCVASAQAAVDGDDVECWLQLGGCDCENTTRSTFFWLGATCPAQSQLSPSFDLRTYGEQDKLSKTKQTSHSSCKCPHYVTYCNAPKMPQPDPEPVNKPRHSVTTYSNAEIIVGFSSDGKLDTAIVHRLPLDGETMQRKSRVDAEFVRTIAAVAVNETIFAVGSFVKDTDLTFLTVVRKYDAKTGLWTSHGFIERGIINATVTANDDFLFIVGGVNQHGESREIIRYSLHNASWQTMFNMQVTRQRPAVAIVDDVLTVIGGFHDGVSTSTFETFHVNSWTATPSKDLPEVVDDASFTVAVAFNKAVYAFGSKGVLVLHGANNERVRFVPHTVQTVISAAVRGDKLLFIGSNDAQTVVFMWDPATDFPVVPTKSFDSNLTVAAYVLLNVSHGEEPAEPERQVYPAAAPVVCSGVGSCRADASSARLMHFCDCRLGYYGPTCALRRAPLSVLKLPKLVAKGWEFEARAGDVDTFSRPPFSEYPTDAAGIIGLWRGSLKESIDFELAIRNPYLSEQTVLAVDDFLAPLLPERHIDLTGTFPCDIYSYVCIVSSTATDMSKLLQAADAMEIAAQWFLRMFENRWNFTGGPSGIDGPLGPKSRVRISIMTLASLKHICWTNSSSVLGCDIYGQGIFLLDSTFGASYGYPGFLAVAVHEMFHRVSLYSSGYGSTWWFGQYFNKMRHDYLTDGSDNFAVTMFLYRYLPGDTFYISSWGNNLVNNPNQALWFLAYNAEVFWSFMQWANSYTGDNYIAKLWIAMHYPPTAPPVLPSWANYPYYNEVRDVGRVIVQNPVSSILAPIEYAYSATQMLFASQGLYKELSGTASVSSVWNYYSGTTKFDTGGSFSKNWPPYSTHSCSGSPCFYNLVGLQGTVAVKINQFWPNGAQVSVSAVALNLQVIMSLKNFDKTTVCANFQPSAAPICYVQPNGSYIWVVLTAPANYDVVTGLGINENWFFSVDLHISVV